MKRAFYFWPNLAFLAAATSGFLLTRNPRIALIALGIEAAWLLVVGRSKAFRQLDALTGAELERQKQEFQIQDALSGLSPELRQRYRTLEDNFRAIQKLATDNKNLTDDILKPEIDKLHGLRDAFVKLAGAYGRLSQSLTGLDVDAIERDIGSTQKELSELGTDSSDMLRDTLKEKLTLAEQRLADLRSMRERHRAFELQLENIERTFDHLKARIAGFNRAEELATQVDSVLTGIRSAERTLEETAKIEEEARRMAMRQHA